MIPVPSGVRVWLVVDHADTRPGMNRLAIQFQQVLHCDPLIGDLYMLQGKSGHLIKSCRIWQRHIGPPSGWNCCSSRNR
jgi:transposase